MRRKVQLKLLIGVNVGLDVHNSRLRSLRLRLHSVHRALQHRRGAGPSLTSDDESPCLGTGAKAALHSRGDVVTERGDNVSVKGEELFRKSTRICFLHAVKLQVMKTGSSQLSKLGFSLYLSLRAF